MKAYVLNNVNDLRYEEVSYPNCPDGWVVVKIKACGICSSDIPRIFKKGTYHFPTICGHEFAGIIDSVSNDSQKKLIGKKVGIFPLIPCKKCEQCLKRNYEMCLNYDYAGSRRDGGFAEYVAVPEWNIVELDDNISYFSAAMMEPLSVALHALKQSKMKVGDSIAIIGTGMIGLSVAQWARKYGASKVTVIGRNEDKLRFVKKLQGIDYVLFDNCCEEYNVVIEAVGSNSSINKAISCTKVNGNVLLMGNPESDIYLNQNIYWRILRKQLHVYGTWNSSYEKNDECDWEEVKHALSNKEIEAEILISHVFKQEELKRGLEIMRDHKEPYCKIMTIWNEEE